MKARTKKVTAPEADLGNGCAGVLDARDIAALNTALRARGVSDHDRHEVLKTASMFAAAVDRPRRLS